MQSMNREKYIVTAKLLGRAINAIQSGIGNTYKDIKSKYLLEKLLIRTKGSNNFHDSDTASIYNSGVLQWNKVDNIGYGMQGVDISVGITTQLSFDDLPSGTNWNPSVYGPPSPEGWWNSINNGYSAWKGHLYIDRTNLYTRSFHSSYDSSGVNSTASLRNSLLYPGRWNSISSSYDRVLLFDSARWISFYSNPSLSYSNTLNPSSNDTVTLILNSDDLKACKLTNPINNMPLDIMVFSHVNLQQNNVNSKWQTITTPNDNSMLCPIRYSLSTGISSGTWNLNIPVPGIMTSIITGISSAFTWSLSNWWHIVLYMGSKDDYTLNFISTYQNTNNLTNNILNTNPDNELKWQRKNFFDNTIVNTIDFNNTGVQNNNIYLIADKRTHFDFYDGQYSNPLIPSKYPVYSTLKQNNNSIPNNSLSELTTINDNNCLPVIICVKTNNIDSLQNNPLFPEVFFGPQITPEFYSSDWDSCPYFPQVPYQYTEIARYILTSSSNRYFDIPDYGSSFDVLSSLLNKVVGNKISVIWYKQSAYNFVLPPIIDFNLSSILLSKIGDLVNRYRTLLPNNAVLNAAFVLLARTLGVIDSAVSNKEELISNKNSASTLLLNQIKNPTKSAFQDTPNTIYLDKTSRMPIEGLTNISPTTKMFVYDTNNVYLTKEKISIPNTFEIYQEPSESCIHLDSSNAGSRVSQDYVFKFELQDENENVFHKTLPVMASKFLLTQQEMSYKELSGESTLEYYTEDQYKKLGDWQQQGYASLIPDLEMNKSISLLNKVVSPAVDVNGNPVITEDIYRKQLQNQGYNQIEIDNSVAEYIDKNGPFPVIDLSVYDNKFVSLNNMNISVTKFNTSTIPYWGIKLDNYFMNNSSDIDFRRNNVADLYADSFTISASGNKVGDLESFGAFSNAVYYNNALGSPIEFTEDYRAFRLLDEYSSVNNTNISEIGLQFKYYPHTNNQLGIGSSDYVINSSNYYGVQFSPSNNINLYGVELKFKFNGSGCTNTSDYIAVDLYTDYQNNIGSKIIEGSKILYSSITTSYDSLASVFNSSISLSGGEKYWIVLKQSNNPNNGVSLMLNRQFINTSSMGFGTTTIINNHLIIVDYKMTWYNLLPQIEQSQDVIITPYLYTEKLNSDGNYIPDYAIRFGNNISLKNLTANFQEYKFSIPFDFSNYIGENASRVWMVLQKKGIVKNGSLQIQAGNSSDSNRNYYKITNSVSNSILSPVNFASTSIDFSYNYISTTQKMYIGTNIIDGYTIGLGDRILLKDFIGTESTYNGIYTLTGDDNLTRSSDFNQISSIISGSLIKVGNGITNINKIFRLISPNPVFIDTSNIIFQEYSEDWMQDKSPHQAWYKFYATPTQRLSTFNRNDALDLAPANNYRQQINPLLTQDGLTTWTLSPLNSASNISIYPRAVWNYSYDKNPPSVYYTPVRLATTSNIGILTFANNILASNGIVTSIDNVKFDLGDRILFKDITPAKYNGIYSVTGIGTTATTFKRTEDFNSTYNVLNNGIVLVNEGIINKDLQYQITSENPISINSSNINFGLYANYFQYIPNTKDIHLFVRTFFGKTYNDYKIIVSAGNTTPIQIGNTPVDGISYIAVGKGYESQGVACATTSISDVQISSFSNNSIYVSVIPTVIDGITLKHNDRVLIKNYAFNGVGTQDPKYNGVYRYIDPNEEYIDSSDRTTYYYQRFIRAYDCNSDLNVYAGMGVRVLKGSTNSNNFYRLNINDDNEKKIVLNKTALIFSESEPVFSPDLSPPWYGSSSSDKIIIRSS